MRVAFILVMSCVLRMPNASAQGNPRDFGRAGPAQEMQRYYARVQKEVYEEVLLRWRSAAERHDATAVARHYAEDASYYPPASAVVQTRSAIRDHFASFLNTTGSVDVHLIDFGTSGDLAYIAARVSFNAQTESGQSQKRNFTDLMVLRRSSRGDWQIQMHLSRPEP